MSRCFLQLKKESSHETGILNQIFIKYGEKRYLSHFVSEMFDFFTVRFYLRCSTI